MAIEGVDFSWARPSGAALVKAGKHFVVRYVPYSGDGGKGLTAEEIKDYRSHGLDICVVFESTAGRAKAGRAAGQTDADTARKSLARLGFPVTTPIYFAVDWDATAAQFPIIDEYLGGAASVIGVSRVGIYGHARLMAHCLSVKSASWFWQTYAWSAGVLFSGAHLYQYQNHALNINGAMDLTRALKANYGQWAASSSLPQEVTDVTYQVPKVPMVGDLAKDVVLYTTLPINPTDPLRKIIDPARTMPWHGNPVAGFQIVEYVDDKGVHSGQAYFVKTADLKNIRPAAAPVDTTEVAALQAQITTLKGEVAAAKLSGAQSEWDRQAKGATIGVKLLDRP